MDQSKNISAFLSRRRKPDFFIVGAAKSGTSSLYSYLIQHPDIFMPHLKEPHFFYNRESPGEPVLADKDVEEYLRLFAGVPDDVRAGEASTSYLYLENAPKEIKQIQKDAKIVMLLRNPADRAYSQYWTEVRNGRETLSFEDALKSESKRDRQNWWHGSLYVKTGQYAEQVSRYLELFGHHSVQVHLFEDLIYNAEGVCRKTFSFLDVDPDWAIDTSKTYNPGGPPKSRLLSRILDSESIKGSIAKTLPASVRRKIGERLRHLNSSTMPEMNPEIRHGLQKTFKEDILRLEELIERDLSGWKQ